LGLLNTKLFSDHSEINAAIWAIGNCAISASYGRRGIALAFMLAESRIMDTSFVAHKLLFNF